MVQDDHGQTVASGGDSDSAQVCFPKTAGKPTPAPTYSAPPTSTPRPSSSPTEVPYCEHLMVGGENDGLATYYLGSYFYRGIDDDGRPYWQHSSNLYFLGLELGTSNNYW